MFYSVDILNRKGRLGLIWLAATYGDSTRAMRHKDYRTVNIPRACRDIADPIVPFALRLSSNLMVGVVRIYREQTKIVWVEASHIWKTIKNATLMKPSQIDLPKPFLREEAVTEPLDFTPEAFFWDLSQLPIIEANLGTEGYFTVNGVRHVSPRPAPPLPTGPFSPPSLVGTPVPHGTPGWLQEWRLSSESDNYRSPHQAQPADIQITDLDPIHFQQPIEIPGEVDITGELLLPGDDINAPLSPVRRSPVRRSPDRRSPERRSPDRRSPDRRSPDRRSPDRRSPDRRSPDRRSPDRRSPDRRSPERRSPERRSPDRRSLDRRSPERRSPERRSPDRRSPDRRSPERRSPERRSPDRRSPERRSPERRSPERRSPERHSPERRSPERRSPDRRSPERRSPERRSPERRSPERRSPERRSPERRSPERRSPERRSPERHSPDRRLSPPPEEPRVPLDLLDAGEPSLDDVLTIDQVTGELVPLPQAMEPSEIPLSAAKPSEDVERGLVTPSVQPTAEIPSPPKKRRRLAIDRNIQIHADVIRHNVNTEGRETLCERSLEEHQQMSAKDLFTTPATEALGWQPFIGLWRRNAVTASEDYYSRTSPGLGETGGSSPEVETPTGKEIARASIQEGSGIFEYSDFTPDLQESGVRERDLSTSGDRGMVTDLDMEPIGPRERSSSLLPTSLTGRLSPIQEPTDFDDYLEEIGDLATVIEQSEVTQSLEEHTFDTWRLITRAMGHGDGPVDFASVYPPHFTARKIAAKSFYHLLALHKDGVFQLHQKAPYLLTRILITKGANF